MNHALTWTDFEKVDIRTGTILQAEIFVEAKKPAYKLQIDFGELGIKKSSAQITVHYVPEELIGKQIVAVVNFPPKQIGPFMSECLVLGVVDGNGGVVLLQPDKECKNGLRVG
ncbi:MAG: tRNA-binding protein [Crocinitomicaceae bacterium]|nr:tRNA-binding protein [Crocinitomicaceae bacterium]MBK8924750.1 tRNA-binding protein [Crocinitomicaceae bacterium]